MQRFLDCYCCAVQTLEGRVHELEVQGLTAGLTGLASLRMRPHALLSELDSACADAVRASKCTLSELALAMSAFAQLGAAAPELCNAVLQHDHLLAAQHKLDVQSRIMLVWAMWLLSLRSGNALCAQQEQALYDLAPSHGVSDTALVQLFQVREIFTLFLFLCVCFWGCGLAVVTWSVRRRRSGT